MRKERLLLSILSVGLIASVSSCQQEGQEEQVKRLKYLTVSGDFLNKFYI